MTAFSYKNMIYNYTFIYKPSASTTNPSAYKVTPSSKITTSPTTKSPAIIYFFSPFLNTVTYFFYSLI